MGLLNAANDKQKIMTESDWRHKNGINKGVGVSPCTVEEFYQSLQFKSAWPGRVTERKITELDWGYILFCSK